MANTALSAKMEQASFTEKIAYHITFRNEEHKKFFLNYLLTYRYENVYHTILV